MSQNSPKTKHLHRPKLLKLTLTVLTLTIVVSAGWYSYSVWQAHQLQSKLGWTPNLNSSPGAGSSVKPVSNESAPLENDAQLPTPQPTPEPQPGQPDIRILFDGDPMNAWSMNTNPGESTKTVTLDLIASNMDLSSCTVTDNIVVDDAAFTKQTATYAAVARQSVTLIDGMHTIVVSCSKPKLTRESSTRIEDHQPKLCKGYTFTDNPISANALDDVKSGIVGTWKGCAYTPWVPPYYVTLTFNADGSYQSDSSEIIDGQPMIALYWGQNGPDPQKKYSIDDFQNSLGSGSIETPYPEAGTLTTSTIKNVKLMGNELTFDLYRGTYGPVQFKLTKQ